MKDDKIICNCRNITVGKIKTAIKNGAKTFEQVKASTGVSTSCGKCSEHAKSVVESLISKI